MMSIHSLLVLLSLIGHCLSQPDAFSVADDEGTPSYAITTLTDQMISMSVGSMISKEIEVTSDTIDKTFELLETQDSVPLYNKIPREKIRNVIDTLKLKMTDPGSKDTWYNEYVEMTVGGMNGHIIAINSHILDGGKCRVTINGLTITGTVPKLYSTSYYNKSFDSYFLGAKVAHHHRAGLNYVWRALTIGEIAMINAKLRNRLAEVRPSLA